MLKEAAPSLRTFMGAACPLPQKPAHGPSESPTCSGRWWGSSSGPHSLTVTNCLLMPEPDCTSPSSDPGAARSHGALACIFSRQLIQNATSRLSRLMQKSVKSFSSRSANFSSPVALERHVLVSMVL